MRLKDCSGNDVGRTTRGKRCYRTAVMMCAIAAATVDRYWLVTSCFVVATLIHVIVKACFRHNQLNNVTGGFKADNQAAAPHWVLKIFAT